MRLLCASVLGLAICGFATAGDSFAGTWKLNPAKKQVHRRIYADGNTLTLLERPVAVNEPFTAVYDRQKTDPCAPAPRCGTPAERQVLSGEQSFVFFEAPRRILDGIRWRPFGAHCQNVDSQALRERL